METLGEAKDAEKYFTDHSESLQSLLDDAVQELFENQPPDHVTFLATYFGRAADEKANVAAKVDMTNKTVTRNRINAAIEVAININSMAAKAVAREVSAAEAATDNIAEKDKAAKTLALANKKWRKANAELHDILMSSRSNIQTLNNDNAFIHLLQDLEHQENLDNQIN